MNDKIFEALSELEEEAKWCHNDGETLTKYDEERFNVIKQALLNAQDLEKFTRLVIEKAVDVYILNECGELETYNEYALKKWGGYYTLTEEQYSFAKKMVEKYE